MKKILLILLLLIIYPLSVGAEDVQSADGSFTWSIPSSLNLSEDVQMDIAIKNIALEENKILDVKVSSANKFKLISESAQEITYELYGDGNTKLSSGDTVLKYQKGTTNKTTNSLVVNNVNIPDDVTTGRFSDNLTFTANVSDDPNYYTITYNLDGGTLEGSYPTMYNTNVGVTLPTPVKDGYEFLGWNDGTNDITSIVAGTTGNKVLTAKWKQDVSIISFTINNTSYQAEEGMTWVEWINSSYNTIGYIIRTNGLGKKYVVTDIGSIERALHYNDAEVEATNKIVSDRNYEFVRTNVFNDRYTLSRFGLDDVDMNGDGVYDEFRAISGNGTLVKLLAMDSYASVYYGDNNTYLDSTLDNKMAEYYNLLPENVRNAIVAQNIDQRSYSMDYSSTGKDVLHITSLDSLDHYYANTDTTSVGSRNVFALDIQDIADYLGNDITGAKLNEMFFDTTDSIDRYAWLRSASADDTDGVFGVLGNYDGVLDYPVYANECEVRPAFVIDLSKTSSAQAASTLSLRNDEPVTQESIININYITSSGIQMIQDQITGNVGETITYYPEEFVGYTTDESIELTFTEDEQSIDVIYTPIEYTISFSEGLEPIAYTIESEDIVLPSLETEGFLDWMNGEEPIEMIEAGSTGNYELTAKFEENVSQKDNGGSENNSETAGGTEAQVNTTE